MQGHHIHVRDRVEVALSGSDPSLDGSVADGSAADGSAYSWALPVGWRRKGGGKNEVSDGKVHLEVLLFTAAGPGALHLVQHQVLQAAREDPEHRNRKKGHVPGVTNNFISEHGDALIWVDVDSKHILSVGYDQWDFFLRVVSRVLILSVTSEVQSTGQVMLCDSNPSMLPQMGFGPAMDIALFEPAPNSAAGGFWVNLEGMFASRHNTSRIDVNPLTAPQLPSSWDSMDISWDSIPSPDGQVPECQSTFHLLTFSRCKFGEVGVTGTWTIEPGVFCTVRDPRLPQLLLHSDTPEVRW